MRAFLLFSVLLVAGLCCQNGSQKVSGPDKPDTSDVVVTRCEVRPTRLRFTVVRSDSFLIKNAGETVLTGKLSVRNEIPSGHRYFYIQSALEYELEPGDSTFVRIAYVDYWRYPIGYTEEGTIETGNRVCKDVYCTGRF